MNKGILNLFLFLTSINLYAAPYQSLDLLKNKIEQQVLNELTTVTEGVVKVSADTIDPRLNLKECAEEKLIVFNPYPTPLLNASTMGIKCIDERNHWTLYVPIKVNILKTVLVSKNALLKGNVVKADDIYQTEMDTKKLKQGYFTKKSDLIGLACRHDISADSPFNPYNIELPKLVHQGEQVTIVANNENLTVSMAGVALMEGVMGDTIRVKNLSSKKIIEAQVTGRKNVNVVL